MYTITLRIELAHAHDYDYKWPVPPKKQYLYFSKIFDITENDNSSG